MDRGAWLAAVHGVTKSGTILNMRVVPFHSQWTLGIHAQTTMLGALSRHCVRTSLVLFIFGGAGWLSGA